MAKVRVFFATNRNHLEGNKIQVFGKSFNPDGVAALRFGYADYQSDDVRPKLLDVHVYPDNKGETDIARTGGGMFMAALHRAMATTKKTDTLVFIHGFNVSFMGALEAGALLGQSLRVKDPDEDQGNATYEPRTARAVGESTR